MINTAYCKRKLLQLGLQDVLVHEYHDKSLGFILILLLFSRMILVDHTMLPMIYIVTGSWSQN